MAALPGCAKWKGLDHRCGDPALEGWWRAELSRAKA